MCALKVLAHSLRHFLAPNRRSMPNAEKYTSKSAYFSLYIYIFFFFYRERFRKPINMQRSRATVFSPAAALFGEHFEKNSAEKYATTFVTRLSKLVLLFVMLRLRAFA